MLKKFGFVMVACMLSLPASAIENSGLVKGFYVDTNGTVLLKLVVNTSVPPQCSGGGAAAWDYVFTLSNSAAKQWMNMITIARTTAIPIRIDYTANTTGICSVNYLFFLD
jgi:hypothetical protein